MTPRLPGMESEERKPELSQWFTPPVLAQRIVDWALESEKAAPRIRVLEPSAGRGALAVPLRERVRAVTCCEIDPDNENYLVSLGFDVYGEDFLTIGEAIPRFNLAVMNPPFEGGQTEAHIMHALTLADRVVCHCPLTTLAGKARRESMWSRVHLLGLAICSSRPKYGADGGKTDMCTVNVIARLPHETTGYDTHVEWWP